MGKSIDIARLSVVLGADTVKYITDMDKAQKKTKKDLDKMNKSFKKSAKVANASFKKIGKSIAKGTAVITAALVATSALRIEHEQLARAAGLTGDEFDVITTVFGSVGLEAEKTSDLLRDLNIKISEGAVLASGAGYEALNKLGISMESIKDKSPVDQLFQINTAMQELGYTADAQKLIWDEFGSDLDKLQPLLADGAAEFEKLNAIAKDLDLKIPDEDLDSLKLMGVYTDATTKNMVQLGAYIAGQFSKEMTAVITEVNELAQDFVEWNTSTDTLKNTIELLAGSFKYLWNVAQISFNLLSIGFDTILTAGDLAFNELAYGISNFGVISNEIADRFVNFWKLAFLTVNKDLNEFLLELGENLDGVWGFEDISAGLIESARVGLKANSDAVDTIEDKKKANADAEIARNKAHNDIQIGLVEGLADRTKETNDEILKNMFEGINGLTKARTAVISLVTGSADGGTGTDGGAPADGESESNPKVDEAKSTADQILSIEAKLQQDIQALKDSSSHKAAQLALGDVDAIGEAFGLQLDAQKTFTMASLAIQEASAIGATLADPELGFWAKTAAVISMTAQFAALSGQFGDGSDEVDHTGSYLINKGERVIQPVANKKLTKFLDSAPDPSNGGGGGNNITQNINGSAMMSKRDFDELLSRSNREIAALNQQQTSKRASTSKRSGRS
jgi:hypothetical protein